MNKEALKKIVESWDIDPNGRGGTLSLHIWYKLKLTRSVLDTTFKVPIKMKIYIGKIQDEVVIIISKNKYQNDFFNPLHYAPTWGVKNIPKI